VTHHTFADQAAQLAQRNQLDDGFLGGLAHDIGHAPGAAAQERVQPVSEQGGIRIHAPERYHLGSAVARLLEKLAGGRRGGSLTWVDQSTRRLESERPRAVPVLIHHRHAALARDWDDVHPVRGLDSEEVVV
jgi:hypothetical protein